MPRSRLQVWLSDDDTWAVLLGVGVGIILLSAGFAALVIVKGPEFLDRVF